VACQTVNTDVRLYFDFGDHAASNGSLGTAKNSDLGGYTQDPFYGAVLPFYLEGLRKTMTYLNQVS
jgi:hypothetical protein